MRTTKDDVVTMPDAPLNPDALDMRAYDEALLAFKKATPLYPGQAVALKDAVMAYAKHLAVAQPEVNSVEELAKAWHAGFCKGEQTALRERPVNPDTINPYKNGEKP